jgi:hypothetical protein
VAARLADALIECFGEAPLTARDLAAAVTAVDRPHALIRALQEALGRAADENEDLDCTLWGPTPTAEQLASARKESQAAVEEAMSAALSGALTRAQAGRRLGISPQAVSKRLLAGKLVALRHGREKRLPIWQFHEDGVLPGLPELIAAWPGTALALTMWATSPSADLRGQEPARALARRGGVKRVLAAVQALTASAW